MDTIKFGLRYFKKGIFLSIVAELLSFAGIFAELLIPLLSAMLIDYVIKDGTPVTADSGGMFNFLLSGKFGAPHTMEFFFNVALMYFVLAFIRLVFVYARDILQQKVGLDLETDLRYATYEKLLELDSDTLSTFNSGELLQILNQDTINFKELFCHRFPYFGDSIFIFISTVILLSTINIRFMIIPVALIPFLAVTVVRFKKQARINHKEIRKESSRMNLTTQENIAAVRIVRSFTNEELEKEKFEAVNHDYLNAKIKQLWLSSKFDLTFNSIKQVAYIGTLVLSAVLAMRGYMTVGYILATSTYVMRVMQQIANFNNHIFNMQQQIVAGQEVCKFMECESKVSDEASNLLRSDRPHIKLMNVGINIEGQDILKNIDLDIPYGKKVGIVGETGSGKSVLLKSLVRVRDITEGKITIDGNDIKEFSLKNLRDMYSYAFQDVFLFSNTIDSNIAYSKPDTEEENVVVSATQAQANKFIEALQEGYQTVIGERGLGISGGQKQRVSLARAFLKNAPVFVLDDSTSALDVQTERLLLKSLHDNFNEKTVIITAHRLSSVVGCDEIVYLQDGKIAERGTFDELMKLNGLFAKVYNIQIEQQASIVDYDNLANKEVKVNG